MIFLLTSISSVANDHIIRVCIAVGAPYLFLSYTVVCSDVF